MAVTMLEALVQRHAADAESPQACYLRDCLALSMLGAYGGSSRWPAGAVARAQSLLEENQACYGSVLGEAADATLRNRIRRATVAGLAEPQTIGCLSEAMADLKQVLEIAGEASAGVAAQGLVALSLMAMEVEPHPDDVPSYAVRFAEHCLQALGPEHPWSCFAADYLELIRCLVPTSQPQPITPYAPSVKVWEGPYAAKPSRNLEYPRLVPYLLAGDLLGAASRCYGIAAARAAQRVKTADFHAELRATIERQCDAELAEIRQYAAADADLSWLKSWLSEALSRNGELLHLAGPGVTPA
jgi:hypothetical protein